MLGISNETVLSLIQILIYLFSGGYLYKKTKEMLVVMKIFLLTIIISLVSLAGLIVYPLFTYYVLIVYLSFMFIAHTLVKKHIQDTKTGKEFKNLSIYIGLVLFTTIFILVHMGIPSSLLVNIVLFIILNELFLTIYLWKYLDKQLHPITLQFWYSLFNRAKYIYFKIKNTLLSDALLIVIGIFFVLVLLILTLDLMWGFSYKMSQYAKYIDYFFKFLFSVLVSTCVYIYYKYVLRHIPKVDWLSLKLHPNQYSKIIVDIHIKSVSLMLFLSTLIMISAQIYPTIYSSLQFSDTYPKILPGGIVENMVNITQQYLGKIGIKIVRSNTQIVSSSIILITLALVMVTYYLLIFQFYVLPFDLDSEHKFTSFSSAFKFTLSLINRTVDYNICYVGKDKVPVSHLEKLVNEYPDIIFEKVKIFLVKDNTLLGYVLIEREGNDFVVKVFR